MGTRSGNSPFRREPRGADRRPGASLAIETRSAIAIIRDALLAIGLLSLAIVSVRNYQSDLSERRQAATFLKTFAFDQRRPETAETVRLAPSADVAADVLADATLRDSIETINLSAVTPEIRNAWITAVAQLDEQFGGAVDLSLSAVAARPGWPYHQSLLGQLVWQRATRVPDPSLTTEYLRWAMPLSNAARDAFGDEALWQSLALGYLQTWPSLERLHASTAPNAFRNAFGDEDFVRIAFGPAMDVLGHERAAAWLPDAPRSLREAFIRLLDSGDVATGWAVHQRWDSAEWKSRGADLAAIEQRYGRGDADETRQLCEQWTRRHSVYDYDSVGARRQAARLLEVWPSGRQGSWNSDPRAEIVRYFLDGRLDDIEGEVIDRAVQNLGGVPASTRARSLIAAGDPAGAAALARSAESSGSLEWTPYAVELSRYWLRKGDRAHAVEAINAIPAAARDECNSVLARAAVAGSVPPSDATASPFNGRVAVCLADRAPLEFVVAPARRVLDYGIDGARRGSILQRNEWLSIHVEAPAGLRKLFIREIPQRSPAVTATLRVPALPAR